MNICKKVRLGSRWKFLYYLFNEPVNLPNALFTITFHNTLIFIERRNYTKSKFYDNTFRLTFITEPVKSGYYKS